MARVLSCNMNIHTHPDVAPHLNEVESWAWYRRDENPALVREQHRESAMRTLWRFPNAEQVTESFLRHQRFFRSDSTYSKVLSLLWLLRTALVVDRVLAAAPGRGWDRVLWLCTLLFAKLFGKPIYLYSETWYPANEVLPSGLRSAIYRFVASNASVILVPAKVHAMHHVRLGVPADRIHVIDSPYSPRPEVQPLLTDKIRLRNGSAQGLWRFLYVGRIMPLKGLDRLIKVVHSLRQRGYKVFLTVQTGKSGQYGGSKPDYPSTCAAMASELLGPDGFELLQPTPNPDAVYRTSDVLIMPNVIVPQDKVSVESWGRVVEEALLAGLPVISTDAVPAATELVVHGINGMVVSWNDERILEETLAAIMDQPVSGDRDVQ